MTKCYRELVVRLPIGALFRDRPCPSEDSNPVHSIGVEERGSRIRDALKRLISHDTVFRYLNDLHATPDHVRLILAVPRTSEDEHADVKCMRTLVESLWLGTTLDSF